MRTGQTQNPVSGIGVQNSALREVQSSFAKKPLFDDDVATRLAAMERRTVQPMTVTQFGRGTTYPSVAESQPYGTPNGASWWMGNPAAGGGDGIGGQYASFGNGGGSASRSVSPGPSAIPHQAYIMPPQIPRPLSVTQYLMGLGQQQPSHQPQLGVTHFDAANGDMASPYKADAEVDHQQPVKAAADDDHLVQTPRGTRRRTPKRGRSRRHAVEEDEEAAAMRAAQTLVTSARSGNDSDVERTSSVSTHGLRQRQAMVFDNVPRLTDKDIHRMVVEGIDEQVQETRVMSHIERAALRAELQRERLQKKGVEGEVKVGLVDGGVQVDMKMPSTTEMSSGVEATGSGPRARSASVGSRRNSGFAEGGSRTTPQPILLSPSVAYKPASKEVVKEDPILDHPQWKVNAAPKAEFPSTGAMVTAATTVPRQNTRRLNREAQPAEETPGVEAGREAIRRITQRAASPLMERLDDIQLRNEELLVRNKALPAPGEPQPGDAGWRARRVVTRVAEAHRKPNPLAADVPRPLGGYGSVMDSPPQNQYAPMAGGSAAPSSGAQDEFSPSRWQAAKFRNDIEDLHTSTRAGQSDLRKWANDLSTSPAVNKSALRMEPATYNARKKWGNVSFATPLERLDGRPPLNPVEELTASAKVLLHPGTVI